MSSRAGSARGPAAAFTTTAATIPCRRGNALTSGPALRALAAMGAQDVLHIVQRHALCCLVGARAGKGGDALRPIGGAFGSLPRRGGAGGEIVVCPSIYTELRPGHRHSRARQGKRDRLFFDIAQGRAPPRGKF